MSNTHTHLQRANRKWSVCGQERPGPMTTDWVKVT